MIQAPENIIPLDEILPEEPLLMMGAGPVPIPASVAQANSIVVNHLGDTMAQVIEQVKHMSHYVFQTNSKHILGVAGPGSAAMEMAIVNLVKPGDTVLSICNGFFSNRLAEMAERNEANVVRYHAPANQFAPAHEVEALLNQHVPKVLTIVQGETSNTVFNRDLPRIVRLASERGCLVIVDAVCTLSTTWLDMEEWGIDAVITGGQKGLSSIPGVSLVAFSERAWQAIRNREDTLRHWCFDAQLADQFWYKKSYHYTAPVSGILAIHEALRLICNETLPARINRHMKNSNALQKAVEGMGLKLHVRPDSRLQSVVGICLPDGIDAKSMLMHMSERFKVEISGSFGLPIVRVGQMGEQSRAHHLFRVVHALGSSMKLYGAKIDLPEGMAALEKALEDYNEGAEIAEFPSAAAR